MKEIVDQIIDENRQVYHTLSKLYNFPAFVKNATEQDIVASKCGEIQLYCDAARKRYPCATPAATYVSAAYFYHDCANTNPFYQKMVEQNLMKAAEAHGITDAIEDLKKQISENKNPTISEENLPDEEFMYLAKDANNNIIREYPLRNPNEIKVAADFLVNNRHIFNWNERNTMAIRLIKRAESLGVSLKENFDTISRIAGLGTCSAKDACEIILQRANALRGVSGANELVDTLIKTAQDLKQKPIIVYEIRDKIAELIDAVDTYASFRQYSKNWKFPEDVLYNTTEKDAQEFVENIVGNDLTGNYYNIEDLQQIPIAKLTAEFGEKIATRLYEDFAGVLPTLPLSEARAFDRIATACMITPVGKKSACSIGIPVPIQKQLARVHEKSNSGSLWARIKQQRS